MITKNFLEEYPLYRKLEIQVSYYSAFLSYLPKPALNLECKKCGSVQTFNMANEYWEMRAESQIAARRVEIWDIPLRCIYLCSSCGEYSYFFYIQFIKTGESKKDDTSNYKGYVRKIGQVPEWEIDIDKNLEKALSTDSALYKKGLICESQSYGIGSYAYFRRITENIIDELLDSILELINATEREKYKNALERVKKTRITEEKIELVQDLLPASLQPNGINPLKSLHSSLSDGIHNKTDDECLELADTIKIILTYLLEEIRSRNDKAKSFTDKMKTLLGKK